MTKHLLREGDQDRKPGTDCCLSSATPAGPHSVCRPGEGRVRSARDSHSSFPQWKLPGFPQEIGRVLILPDVQRPKSEVLWTR